MLARPHELFAKAFNMQYAIGAFNTSNLEITQAIIWAAEKKQSPVIVQMSEGAIEYAGLESMVAIIRTLAEAAAVPVVMHLDHGKSFAQARACIEAGFTSIMIDASKESFVDNIRITREVVDYAHTHGAWVEAELGAILGQEGAKELAGGRTPAALLTDPEQAIQFVKETQIDALAVSVGTIHGAFTGQEYIRFELLHELERRLPETPLVVHGASGIASKHLREVATSNVCKINVDSEVRIAVEAAVKAYFEVSHDRVDYRDILSPAREAAQLVVEEKMDIFGSTGKSRV